MVRLNDCTKCPHYYVEGGLTSPACGALMTKFRRLVDLCERRGEDWDDYYYNTECEKGINYILDNSTVISKGEFVAMEI